MRTVHTAGFTISLKVTGGHPEIVVQSRNFDSSVVGISDGIPYVTLNPAEALTLGSTLTELGRAGLNAEVSSRMLQDFPRDDA